MNQTQINIDTYECFRCNCDSLQKISKDDSGGKIQYMTNCQVQMVDFDKVKTAYMNKNHMTEESAKSVDALYQSGENVYMIEFKNGDFSPSEIKEKCLDSVLIFNSITGKQLEYDRKYLKFILVYNPEAKKMSSKEKKEYHLALRAKSDYRPFNLKHLYNFIFSDVILLDKNEFEEKFIAKKTSIKK